jgi:hypothetical protein
MALQGGGNMKLLRAAGPHDRGTQIIGIKQDHDLDASGGLELPNEVGGQLGCFLERDAHRGTGLLLDIQPDAPGDDVLPEEQGATDILVAPDIGVGRGVLHLGDRLHRLAPFGCLGVVKDQVDGVSLVGMEAAQ